MCHLVTRGGVASPFDSSRSGLHIYKIEDEFSFPTTWMLLSSKRYAYALAMDVKGVDKLYVLMTYLRFCYDKRSLNGILPNNLPYFKEHSDLPLWPSPILIL